MAISVQAAIILTARSLKFQGLTQLLEKSMKHRMGKELVTAGTPTLIESLYSWQVEPVKLIVDDPSTLPIPEYKIAIEIS